MKNFFFDPLPMFGFDICIVDPPTEFELYSSKGNKKSASAQYDILSWDELGQLPVGHLVRSNGVVGLWACPPTLDKSMWLLKRWGALYKTELVWPKGRVGTGYRARGMHESVLVGVFGNGEQIHDPFWGVIKGKARGHSQKPREFYEMIRERTPGLARCDLFSRETHEGFVAWGNEVGKYDDGRRPERRQKEKLIAPTPLFDMLEVAA
ncbi:N6-adenosine-specific RNA methylase IME4 [Bradyrhizobium sp. USDA 4011]